MSSHELVSAGHDSSVDVKQRFDARARAIDAAHAAVVKAKRLPTGV
jgi:hypothetical protein